MKTYYEVVVNQVKVESCISYVVEAKAVVKCREVSNYASEGFHVTCPRSSSFGPCLAETSPSAERREGAALLNDEAQFEESA